MKPLGLVTHMANSDETTIDLKQSFDILISIASIHRGFEMHDEALKTDDTPQRILEAAEEVFAEKGFKAATVRDILDRANVKNIAAVNYHFRDKERLYIETVKFAHRNCTAGAAFPEWPADTPPRQKLRDFVRVLVLRMFPPGKPCSLQLMMRELSDPTQAGREVVTEYVRPMSELLDSILAELMPDLPHPRRFLFGCSVVGQALFYKTNRSFLVQLMGEEQYQRLDVDTVADHIAAFTLGGIDAALGAPS